MICIPLMAATNAQAIRLLADAEGEPADLYELRLDSLTEPPEVERLIAAATLPVLATCRSARQGGGFAGTLEERRAILQRAIDAGAAYVDGEEDVVGLLCRKNGVVLIASWHDFTRVPDDLDAVTARLAATPCDWVKFAVMATAPADNVAILRAISASPKPAIGIAMGELGLASRILGPAWGSKLTFGTMAKGHESAPGQPTARDLFELYRVDRLTRRTKIYGLIGNPVSQSAGYRLHNRAFVHHGIDAVYIPFLCEDADDFLNTTPDGLDIRGLSVTMPHKNTAFVWANNIGETAEGAGTANTLTRVYDGWLAENTDCLAVVKALGEGLCLGDVRLSGEPALVLGNGGAARAIGVGLAGLGCRVSISGRNAGATEELAEQMGWSPVPWEERAEGDWRVVANATPMGMHPDVGTTAYPSGAWRPGMIAFESVYSPRRTRFLRDAGRAGCQAVDGLEMYVHQAAEQFRIWTGITLSVEECERWLDKGGGAAVACADPLKGSA